ncbi:MAG: NAD(P)-dependent oxidoreductase [Candidatus Omnitrophica bacterium]|nr:NAD(P)-dependent oxidoreductase [Candidatus Omnitrophota bacterium]
MGSLNGKKVCLIGGAGFIGHNMALHLKEHGAEVAIIDGLNVNNLLQLHSDAQNVVNREMYIDFVNQRFKLLRQAGIPLIVEDARNYHKLSMAIESQKPDVVVLLSAVAHANKSNKDPYETFDHSLRTLENALDASKNQVQHFVYFSSSMIYGHFESGMVTEETPCEPLGIYGSLKFSGEKMVKAYHQAFDLPYTIIRPSALYGERCVSRRVGQIFIENAIAGKPITVQGDGDDRLDFTYIQDLIAGIRNVIESPNSINETFNLTYGECRSIAQLADIIKEHFPEITVNYVPKDKLTPDRGTLSVEKAKKLIGYNPQYPLERGFVEYINWYKSLDQAAAGQMAGMA